MSKYKIKYRIRKYIKDNKSTIITNIIFAGIIVAASVISELYL